MASLRHLELLKFIEPRRWHWIDETAKTRATELGLYGYSARGQRAVLFNDFDHGARVNVYDETIHRFRFVSSLLVAGLQ